MSTLFSHFFQKINQISPLEHNFTEVLDTIALKPKILYFYGKMPENVSKTPTSNTTNIKQSPLFTTTERPKTVAIVGSRHNTKYGQEVAYNMAYKLAKEGAVIISGLAYGIDSIAHRAALDAGGITIAVLGTPIDQIYPKNHLKLAAKIIEKQGAILSEYAPHTLEYQDSPLAPAEFINDSGKHQINTRASFLYRNRLISGLADIVVVVEATQKSGSLNTATHALEQGKDVFAVPGNITSPYSEGCNRLIAQGAIPYQSPDGILRILFPEKFTKKRLNKHQITGDTPTETAILQSINDGIRDGEAIIKNTKISVSAFNQTITLLEIKGSVQALGANQWALLN